MSTVREIWMLCDTCGEMAWPEHTSREARKTAREHGWICKNAGDFCSQSCFERRPITSASSRPLDTPGEAERIEFNE